MKILDDIARLKILVIGDVMLDRYWWGSVNRISPEAPVPIVQLENMSIVAGGAANVAANLAGLGATPFLFGIRGNDEEGKLLAGVLNETGIPNQFVHTIPERKTTIKTRIVAHGQHVVRIDQETTEPITNADADEILSRLAEVLPAMDAVIISDYAKGLLTEYVLAGLIGKARDLDKLVVVDPKGRDFSKYAGASIITPNKREAADACALDHEATNIVADAGAMLMGNLNLKGMLITEGEHGMTVFEHSREPQHLEPRAREVYDVTGAGDTVIAAFTAAAAAGNSFCDAAHLASVAAGIVVGQIGTTHITAAMLREINETPHAESLHA